MRMSGSVRGRGERQPSSSTLLPPIVSASELTLMNHGSFWVFLLMSIAWTLYCNPYAALSSSRKTDTLQKMPEEVGGSSGQPQVEVDPERRTLLRR